MKKGCLNGKTKKQKHDFFDSLIAFHKKDLAFFKEQVADLKIYERKELKQYIRDNYFHEIYQQIEGDIHMFLPRKKKAVPKPNGMSKFQIIQWMKDAYVMIGEKNNEGKDEGRCLLGALIHILETEKQKK